MHGRRLCSQAATNHGGGGERTRALEERATNLFARLELHQTVDGKGGAKEHQHAQCDEGGAHGIGLAVNDLAWHLPTGVVHVANTER
jgi:hypothetical protein